MENEYTSVCNECYMKGYHTAPTPCIRMESPKCGECHQSIDGNLIQCTGTNVMIDRSELSTLLTPYYHNRKRVEVLLSDGTKKRGYIGMTTGWKPAYILLARSNSHGSSEVLSRDCYVTEVFKQTR